ncbi:MAG: pilus assembly PilX N-terminal domain-containing protein [Candidatus Acidiferrales bacterium]
MSTQREKGVALITSLLVLILISAIIVGMSWMVLTDQRLGGNNQSREIAFYGAEAGMEKLTTDVANTYATAGALTAANITTITSAPPTGVPGVTFVDPAGISTYQITPTVPVSNNATILPPSPYAGMQGLITPFTLTVAAQNAVTGAEVKLTRQVQAVSIPVFQFGIYSDSDLSFFNGPSFGFGGRTHTNGNLWLAPNDGPLFMGDKVTVVGQVIRTNLENGFAGTSGSTYGGNVSIALSPDPTMANEPGSAPYTNSSWRELAFTEGSVTGTSVYGNISTSLNNPTWTGTVVPAYKGQLQNGVPVLSLTSTALSGITTPISLIRRPVPGELLAAPATFSQILFSQATLRILIDDYPTTTTVPGSAGACHAADMMSLDTVTNGTDPTDLATLGVSPTSPLGLTALPGWYTGTYPLPVSGANATYTPVYTTSQPGYWLKNGYPIITGCIKIEYQTLPGGAWVDYTHQILNKGLTGRNINPTYNAAVLSPNLPALPTAEVAAQGPSGGGVGTVGCADPSAGAIIRFARVRDNPISGTAGAPCGNITAASPATDFWPNVLFDTREGINRASSATAPVTAQGVMNYVELDAKNLVNWFVANQGGLGLNNNTGFTIYFSDRRGEQKDPNAATTRTGSYGFNDFVNPSDTTNGCPNNVLDSGEDLEGDGVFRTYGGTEVAPVTNPSAYILTTANIANLTPKNTLMWPGTNPAAGNLTGVTYKVGTPTVTYSGGLFANSICTAPNANRPDVTYGNAQEARENPPVFFRRALKIVDGAALTIGTSCSGTDGLTIVAENPVYIQGDYNAPVDDGTWGGVSVAAAIEGDAVTFLSNNWNDVNSFAFPYNVNNRAAKPTAYRAAIISGKGIPFPQAGMACGGCTDFGTDGGVHNFLRFLENWGVICHYRGSMVSFYFNRQAVGTYKGAGVYGPPSPRDYTFDTNFSLAPACLPPRTPSLRSVNTIGFSQEILPTQ